MKVFILKLYSRIYINYSKLEDIKKEKTIDIIRNTLLCFLLSFVWLLIYNLFSVSFLAKKMIIMFCLDE